MEKRKVRLDGGCFVCLGKAHIRVACPGFSVHCNCCGHFLASLELVDLISQHSDRHRLSGVLRRASDAQSPIQLDSMAMVESLIATTPHDNDVATKARSLLALAAQRSRPGKHAALVPENDYSYVYGVDAEELLYFISYLEERQWIVDKGRSADGRRININLTPAGWEASHGASINNPSLAVIAMAFHADLNAAYSVGIKPAIETDSGFESFVSNAAEFNGDVMLELMARIRECRFVVADITKQRNGVYFEAGFAIGLGKPVIWTCHEDDINNNQVHFDADHYSLVPWRTHTELREKLARRIQATIGKATSATP